MENSNVIKISIPKPCHEDWNKMTPNDKGSFCGKCCKTVVDFSNKSPEEIKNTLLAENDKKICGRFTTNQLHEKPKQTINLDIPLYLLPQNISYRKAFAIALFFVFGTTLFSCRTTEDHLVGDIAFVDSTGITKQLSNDTTVYFEGDTVKTKSKVKPVCTPITGDIEIERPMGEVEIMQPDTIEKAEPKIGKVKIEE
ncbi:hypothetical protein BH10BAC1_BH10BAC1_20390 [soil metagenome]